MSSLFGKSRRKRSRTESESERDELPTVSGTEQRDFAIAELKNSAEDVPVWASFEDLGLAEPLVKTCRELGFRKPTPVQRTIIPFLVRERSSHVMALASTGSGKTASFVLPIVHHLAPDPFGIYAVILTPTRELAKQIHQQVMALGSAFQVQSALVVGGLDSVRQSLDLDARPHFCVATPGRLAELLRGPKPPRIQHIRYMVLDEADRLLTSGSGFERDVSELLLHCTTLQSDTDSVRLHRDQCQTLLFSATMTRSLESIEELAGAGVGRLPLQKFIIQDSASAKKKEEEPGSSSRNPEIPNLPSGLKQEYVFMPSRVRDTYLITAIRHLMLNGGRLVKDNQFVSEEESLSKARSAIIFVSSCERAALLSETLLQLGVENVALHSLLSQNRRLAALGKFKSQQVNVLIGTDVASRGLDIPHVDLVLNADLPRSPVTYVHRVGRTARAGRRGRAVSLVGENEIALVHAIEKATERQLEKCKEINDDLAVKMLGSVAKALRLARMKLNEIGFDELVHKVKERKVRDKKAKMAKTT